MFSGRRGGYEKPHFNKPKEYKIQLKGSPSQRGGIQSEFDSKQKLKERDNYKTFKSL
jgi:hypothetical protein